MATWCSASQVGAPFMGTQEENFASVESSIVFVPQALVVGTVTVVLSMASLNLTLIDIQPIVSVGLKTPGPEVPLAVPPPPASTPPEPDVTAAPEEPPTFVSPPLSTAPAVPAPAPVPPCALSEPPFKSSSECVSVQPSAAQAATRTKGFTCIAV